MIRSVCAYVLLVFSDCRRKPNLFRWEFKFYFLFFSEKLIFYNTHRSMSYRHGCSPYKSDGIMVAPQYNTSVKRFPNRLHWRISVNLSISMASIISCMMRRNYLEALWCLYTVKYPWYIFIVSLCVNQVNFFLWTLG